jgi:hypothetical protein
MSKSHGFSHPLEESSYPKTKPLLSTKEILAKFRCNGWGTLLGGTEWRGLRGYKDIYFLFPQAENFGLRPGLTTC